VGEWVDVSFGGKEQIGKMQLFNGIGTSMVVWFKGNRAEGATLTFDDGSKQSVVLKNTFKEQEVVFTPVTTSSVRVTFDKVARGKEFNDLCISELTFSK